MSGRGRGRGELPSFTPRPSLGFPPRSPGAGTTHSNTTPLKTTPSRPATCSHGVAIRPASPSTFIEKISRLSQEPDFLDFTIVCGDVNYKVSRLMISAHSPYFKRACTGPFKEGLERTITLLEDEPAAVRAMIQFVRGRGYESSASTPLALHLEVFTVADKYEVMGLKDLAAQRFTKILVALPKDTELGELVSITPQVFATTPADNRLRSNVLMRWQISGLATSLDAAELETLVGDCPAFGTGLILGLSKPAAKEETSEHGKRLLACFPADGDHTRTSIFDIIRQTGLSHTAVLSELSALSAAGEIRYGPNMDSWYRCRPY